jgi:hypothetical protein
MPSHLAAYQSNTHDISHALARGWSALRFGIENCLESSFRERSSKGQNKSFSAIMDNDNTTRIENEFALLEAMYPDEVMYTARSKEFRYRHKDSALLLRLPDCYPETEQPQIISATDSKKVDLRDKLKQAFASLPVGEEALDAIINAFQEAVAISEIEDTPEAGRQTHPSPAFYQDDAKKRTIIIWLHHLLNSNKRKLALSPSDNQVSGISKPGYPGVLIFSGPAAGVQEQVNTLKQQNWAAFQVRYEEGTEWRFEHGAGVKEVESMGEVAKDVGDRKEDFLEAMRMR